MFTRLTRAKGVYLILFILIFFHTFADAALIRGQGRGGVTVSFGTLDMLVPVDIINEFGLVTIDYTPDYKDSVGVPPGYPMVQPLPDDCFVPLGSGQFFQDDPCYWLFNEGETWDLIGSSVSYFVNAAQNITWKIYDALNPSSGPVLEFGNEFSTMAETPSTGSSPINTEIMFTSKTPVDLPPGEYLVQVTMQQTAPPGMTFFSVDTVQGQFCRPLSNDPTLFCFYAGSLSGDVFTRASNFERLVIRQVNEPSLLLLIALPLFMISARLKKCIQQ